MKENQIRYQVASNNSLPLITLIGSSQNFIMILCTCFSPLDADGDESEGTGVDRGRLHQRYHVAEKPPKRKVAETEQDNLHRDDHLE